MHKFYAVALISACAQASESETFAARRIQDIPKDEIDGSNRRTGHYYDPDFKLITSVIFTRDGERDAGMLIPDLTNPEFKENGM
jgi:hypothetical protein